MRLVKKWMSKLTAICAAATILASSVNTYLIGLTTSSLTVTASTSSGTTVTTHTKEEIISYLDNHPFSYSSATYDESPSTTSPYSVGSLSDETKESALNALNCMRYIAGLEEVTLNDTCGELAQSGALINAINHTLSHYPTQPDDMSDDLYDICYAGAACCNLAMGCFSLPSAILGFINEDTETMGHRRWCLNPTMSATGFGEVGWYDAMYVFDQTGSSDATGVAWPAQNMPMNYFSTNDVWTYSLGTEISNTSSIVVTITRESDGETWTLSESSTSDGTLSINNDSYGQTGCIIFRPNDIDEFEDGDIFHVDITGLVQAVSYDVTFFDIDDDTSTETTSDANTTTTNTITENCIYPTTTLIDATDDYGNNYQFISFTVKGTVGQEMTLHYTVDDESEANYSYVIYIHGSYTTLSYNGVGTVTNTYTLESTSTTVRIKWPDASYITDLYYTLSDNGDNNTSTTESTCTSNFTTTTTESTATSANEAASTDLTGDVNLDGAISIADVILLSKGAADLVDLNDTQKSTGDTNADGTISSVDVSILLKFTVQIIQTLPYTG